MTRRCTVCRRQGHTARKHAGLTPEELAALKADGLAFMGRGFRELGEAAPGGDLLDQLQAQDERPVRAVVVDPELLAGATGGAPLIGDFNQYCDPEDDAELDEQREQLHGHGVDDLPSSEVPKQEGVQFTAPPGTVMPGGFVVGGPLPPTFGERFPEIWPEAVDDPHEAEPLVWDRTEHECEPSPDQVMFCRHCGADLRHPLVTSSEEAVIASHRNPIYGVDTLSSGRRIIVGRNHPTAEHGPQFVPWRTVLGPDEPIRVTLPGVYQLDAAEYHDIAVTGDWFSNSDAKHLLKTCPAQFDYDRRNNVRKISDAFDFGHVWHAVILGKGEAYQVFEPKKLDGRTNPGKAQKIEVDAARAAGITPIYGDQFARIEAMAEAVKADPVAFDLMSAPGRQEVCLFWRQQIKVTDPHNSLFGQTVVVQRRAMIDHLPDMPAEGETVTLVDGKTADEVKPDDNLRKKIYDYGYHRQADTYAAGVEALFNRDAEVVFLLQSKKPPHLIVPVDLDTPAMRVAQAENHEAMQVWAECVATGEWPGYTKGVATSGVPAWIERQFEEEMDIA